MDVGFNTKIQRYCVGQEEEPTIEYLQIFVPDNFPFRWVFFLIFYNINLLIIMILKYHFFSDQFSIFFKTILASIEGLPAEYQNAIEEGTIISID